ncbi:MAG: hypothetical protein Kow0073_16690 [Immundisolibacter sp.]
MNRDFQTNESQTAWATDITEAVTPEGKRQLCVVIDLCRRLAADPMLVAERAQHRRRHGLMVPENRVPAHHHRAKGRK